MSENPQIPGVLLTGTIGSGKTAIAIETGERLSGAGEPTAILDLDWLCWLPGVSSRSIDRLMVENLAAAWPRFRQAGARRLILSRASGRADLIKELRSALPDVNLQVVRVSASAATIRQRLVGRDTGATLEEHLAEAEEWTRRLDAFELEAVDLDNDGERPITDVADDLLKALGWRSSPPGDGR